MTSTSMVLGIAALGTPDASPDCDWATDDAGITEFIGLSFLDSVWFIQTKKSTNCTSLSWYQLVPHINLDAAAYRWLQINSHWQAVPLVVVPSGTTNLAVFTICCRELSRRGGWLRHRCQSIARKAAKPRCANASSMPPLQRSWRAATRRPACSR